MRNLSNYAGATDPDIAQQIVLSHRANRAPIYALISGRGRIRTTGDVNPKWKTGTLSGRRTQINNGGTAYTNATTSLAVDDGSIFTAGHLVLAEATGEIMLVTAVASNTITVVRGVGSSVAAHANSVADNAYLSIVSRAWGEGAGSPPATAAGAVEKSNYCQIFRHRYGVSGSLARSDTKNDFELYRQRDAHMTRAIDEIEQAMLHGVKSNDKTDANGNVVRTMAGLREAITTNVTASIGAMSETDFYNAVEPVFGRGSGQKILFAGPVLLTVLNTLFASRLRYTNPQGDVGIQVGRIHTPHGPVDVAPHYGLTTPYAGDGVLVDPEEIEIRPLEGKYSADAGTFRTGRLHVVEGTETPGTDGRFDEIFAELTLTYGDELAHGQLRGVTSADIGEE